MPRCEDPLWRASTIAELPDIWAWIKPWKLSAGTSTGQVWPKKSRTLCAVVTTAKGTKRPGTRGMAPYIPLSFPMPHGFYIHGLHHQASHVGWLHHDLGSG